MIEEYISLIIYIALGGMMISNGLIPFYVLEHYHGKFLKDKKTNELILENRMFKVLFVWWVFINTFILLMLLVWDIISWNFNPFSWDGFFVILLAVGSMFLFFLIWGHRVVYDGRMLNKKCWWTGPVSKPVQDIRKILKTANLTIITFRGGKKMIIPDIYTSGPHLRYDLRKKVPYWKWFRKL